MALTEDQRAQLLEHLPQLDESMRAAMLRSSSYVNLDNTPEEDRLQIQLFLMKADNDMTQLVVYYMQCKSTGKSSTSDEILDTLTGMWSDVLSLLSDPNLEKLYSLDTYLDKDKISSAIKKFNHVTSDSFSEQRSRKKRKSRLTSVQEPLPTANSFSPLTEMDVANADEETGDPVPPAPPATKVDKVAPIYIKIDANWTSFLQHVNTAVVEKPLRAKLNGELIKVQPYSISDYRKLTQYLISKEIPFHALLPRDERPVKILIRGLPVPTPIAEITNALAALGFEPRSVAHLKHRGSRRPMPLFIVNIVCHPGWEKIFDVVRLFEMDVEISKFKFTGTKQCYRCQGFFHSSLTCSLPPRCVRCGEGHLSKDCTRDRKLKPTCALCKGEHPANYRGCMQHPHNRPKKGKGNTKDTVDQLIREQQTRERNKNNFSWKNRNDRNHPTTVITEEEFPPLPSTSSSKNDSTPSTSSYSGAVRHTESNSKLKSEENPASLLGSILRCAKDILQSFNFHKIFTALRNTSDKIKNAKTDMDRLYIGMLALTDLANALSSN